MSDRELLKIGKTKEAKDWIDQAIDQIKKMPRDFIKQMESGEINFPCDNPLLQSECIKIALIETDIQP